MSDHVLRASLAELLEGKSAHASPKQALDGVTPGLRAKRPAPDVHSVWEELEHIRLAQEDILRYTIDPEWTSPPWPDGYWPAAVDSVSDEQWQASIANFFADLEELQRLAADPSVDLTAPIAHGEKGHTVLREILLAADHNAYHFGQLVQARKLLGNWPG